MRWKNIGVASIAGLALFIGAASGGSDSSSSGGSSSGGSGSSSSDAVGIGKPAADGKFTFTLNSVQCGIPSVGDTANGLGATAQGQFCKANITVANTGTEAQDFSSSSQYAFDASGKKFSDSTEADIYANSSQNILNGINPGNSVTTDIYYDIPTGSSIAKFEFHDSPFSGGVTVNNK